jgi:uncharacterized membrane-anchored protein
MAATFFCWKQIAVCASEQTLAMAGTTVSAYRMLKPPDRRNTMPLITLVVTLVVVGLILWLINNYIPMDGTIKKILNVVVVIAVILWLLSVFGLMPPLSQLRIG